MKTPILPIMCAALLTACGVPLNPCNETSPLWGGLSQQQKDNCHACGSPSECPEAGETGPGDEPDPGQPITCPVDDDRVCLYGENLPSVIDALGVIGGMTVDTVDDCSTLSANTFECARDWDGRQAVPWAKTTCVLCNAGSQVTQEPHRFSHYYNTASGQVHWDMLSLCRVAGSPDPVMEAPVIAPALTEIDDDWAGSLSCPDGTSVDHECTPIQIWEADDPWTHNPSNNWTCRCNLPDSPSQCQPGAVCEAGYRPKPGFIMYQPTICTWDDGSGTLNGAAPEGPVVYGLTQWSDGVTVDAAARHSTVVTLTPSMTVAMLGSGPWNDDQRWDGTGTDDDPLAISWCGPESLCAHVGLAVGDEVEVTDYDLIELWLTADVTRVDGSTWELIVQVDL